jgi:hypothetical protein
VPFKSLAQEGYLHEHPEILGSKLKEWDAATKGKHLPKRKSLYRHAYNMRKQEHRLMGGPVEVGHPYTVGEGGSETFVPREPGLIVPHGGPVGPAKPVGEI